MKENERLSHFKTGDRILVRRHRLDHDPNIYEAVIVDRGILYPTIDILLSDGTLERRTIETQEIIIRVSDW